MVKNISEAMLSFTDAGGFLFIVDTKKIIVNKKLDCLRLIAFAMTWRETTGWASL